MLEFFGRRRKCANFGKRASLGDISPIPHQIGFAVYKIDKDEIIFLTDFANGVVTHLPDILGGKKDKQPIMQ